MKGILAVAAGCVLFFSSCTKSLVGEGPVVTQPRQVAHFSKVAVNGDATVEIVAGTGIDQKVTVTGYDNLVRIYETFVSGDQLNLQFEKGYNNIRNINIHVLIETPDIHGASLNGSGAIAVKNFTSGSQLNAGINGSGNVTIQNSSFDMLSLFINGSGSINAVGAPSRDAEVQVTGSGDIEVNCNHKIKMSIFGSGNIDYYGNPALTDVTVSGSGKITKR